MTEPSAPPRAPAPPALVVTVAPHLAGGGPTTRRMMADVLTGLVPALVMATVVFRWHAVKQVGLCILACLAFEALFAKMRGKRPSLGDLSAAVTGAVLGLSLPWSAPWYVGIVAGGVAVGIGKAVFGGLGQNLFNPAMVGRAFVMIAFPAAMGAGAFLAEPGSSALEVLTQATPLSAAKQAGVAAGFWPLFVGTRNGSLGEVSALACLLGGLYLCLRRTASWEIPAGMLAAVAIVAAAGNALSGPQTPLPMLGLAAWRHLLSGAVLFGAFFIATDPVTSPLTPRGKWIFGAGIGTLIMVIRIFSGYPEGVMFAVLIMNSLVPLIDRWTIPVPVGGPVPRPAAK